MSINYDHENLTAMNLYKTTAVDTLVNSTPRPDHISWQASQTDASKARTAARSDNRKATSATVNFPTAKGPLLEWLNDNVNQ